MSSMYTVMQVNEHSLSIRLSRSGLLLDTSSKGNFEKMMQSRMDINDFVKYIKKPKADGTKEPDETFVFRNEVLFWWEKKNQTVSGSVAEKLQGAEFKRMHLQERFPKYKVVYGFVLGEWFEKDFNCRPVLDFFSGKDIPYFFASDTEYKDKIEDYMHSVCMNTQTQTSSTPVLQNSMLTTQCVQNTNILENAPRPLLKWVGGKNQLMKHLVNRVPQDMLNYYEPFVGGGSVLLTVMYMRQQGHITIRGSVFASDLNRDLIGFYKNVQQNVDELHTAIAGIVKAFRNIPHTKRTPEAKGKTDSDVLRKLGHHRAAFYYDKRNEYKALKDSDAIQKSALLYFLIKANHGGMYRESAKSGYNIGFGWNSSLHFDSIEHWKCIAGLIKDVHFSASDFKDVLNKPTQADFAYIDSPYVPMKKTDFVSYQKSGFDGKQHQALFASIRNIAQKGCFVLMSNSNTGPVVNSFTDFLVTQVDAKRAINVNDPGARTTEVFVQNYTTSE